MKKISNISWTDVKITGGFWKARKDLNKQVTLQVEYKQCKDSGRIDAPKCLYKLDETGQDKLLDRANGPELGTYSPDGKVTLTSLAELSRIKLDENIGEKAARPHQYWDSDLAKWIEAVAYSLVSEPNPEMESVIDEIIDDYEKMQMPDGYLNVYFTVVEPGRRWTNVTMMHELYCAGHLTEAAVAYFEATGKRKFLDIICRYIDHIDTVFGPEEGKLHGYPGHQEIELALVKLYNLTGNEKYLKLSKYFIDERGKQPLFFDEEAKRENRDPNKPFGKGFDTRDTLAVGPYAQKQAHLPVREQESAEGHAVRMMYMCCGMTDVAVETGDEGLLAACNKLWDNVTLKKMYITGGVGAESHGERFSFEYHLPNESAYNETCASIGLVMWASRMLQSAADRKYSDVMERALYNGVISGVSITGDRFFYANHLACHPKVYEDRVERQTRMFPVRQEWFPVACCPPNLARQTESVSGYACSQSGSDVYIHLYMDCDISVKTDNGRAVLEERTEYPWDETVRFTVRPEKKMSFAIMLRIPEWCEAPMISINGVQRPVEALENGYLRVEKTWEDGDAVELVLPMKPFLLEAHPSVRMNCGRAAIQCGPFIYCIEETDNGKNLFDISLDKDSHLETGYDTELFGGVRYVTATAKRRRIDKWAGALYSKAGSEYESCTVKAIPYYLWSNRTPGEMLVWMRYRD